MTHLWGWSDRNSSQETEKWTCRTVEKLDAGCLDNFDVSFIIFNFERRDESLEDHAVSNG
jgi:hypothetical protein